MTAAVPGVFVPVVGPSGVGKDTLLNAVRDALSEDPRIVFVRRVITRRAGGNEEHDSLDDAGFDAALDAGRFALHWGAHGLRYGIPVETIAAVAAGRVVVANLSRHAVAEARGVYPSVRVVRIAAPPAVLAERLRARGRESEAEIAERLRRLAGVPPDPEALLIDNGGRLTDAVAAFAAALRRLAEGAVVAAQ